ncbi:MAG: FKBP-type peptidyl-prolyl cis-trans isomerase FkpA [Saprospiraceae bacterium]|jgi:FKBP-type peptidyl-prolyl cis-trans isomerase FkpA|tara:strand:+ start:826 stop:1716 length:891 start_codon:yes stop_codon:yes gene_type:complete
MFKRLLICLVVISLAACGQKEEKELVTPSGFPYTHSKVGTEKANPGDFLSFTLTIEGSDGRVLQDMPEGPNMPVMQLPTEEKPLLQSNPILEAMESAAIGDTIILTMPIDSLPQVKSNPQYANLTSLKYTSVLIAIQDEQTKKAADEVFRLEQEAAEEESKKRIPEVSEMIAETLKDYKSGKLKTEELDSGLKYVIHEQGDGVQAENGKRVSVDYYGVTMDGKMFDNSYRAGRPYTFPLGASQVIKGWDLGIPLLKVGGKATIFIPYELGYGEAGSPPNIGPKAELVFYVELTDVK